MRRSPEVLVNRLRNRKGRVITYAILTLVLGAFTLVHWLMARSMIAGITPKEGEDAVFHLILNQPMLVGISQLQALGLFWGAGFGLSAAALAGELFAFTKNDLLVELWDRVQALERAQRSESGTLPQPPGSAGQDEKSGS